MIASFVSILRDVIAPDVHCDRLTLWVYLPLSVAVLTWAVLHG